METTDELAPIQRLAVKIAAAFGDVQKELGPVPTPHSGRPRVQFSRGQLLLLRQAGHSWREIARELHIGRGTAWRVPRAFASLEKSQNTPESALRAEVDTQKMTEATCGI
jgi:DNA invertase Pin-like site-specific DNA recombinase